MSNESITWKNVEYFIIRLTGKKPDLNAALLLIGMRELGVGKTVFSKEEKQDLLHIATCKILSYSGHYSLIGKDHDGWPHWKLEDAVPQMELAEQENYLKEHVVEYFVQEEVL